MSHVMRRRATTTLLLASLAIGALAAPAAAGAQTTRYVDDDGLVGANGCNGGLSGPSSIQDAVDASAPGDTVIVCPGGYPETVSIETPDLTIRGSRPWKAGLRPTSVPGGAIIDIGADADGTRIQWLKVVSRTQPSCALVTAGIRVNGADDARIISNRVVTSGGGDSRYGPCGFETGIHVATGGSALVRYNFVRDFRVQGIWLQAADPGTAVKDNSVRFLHPTGCLTTACVSRVGPAVALGPVGIHVHATSAIVTNNAVSNAPDADQFAQFDVGIRVNAISDVTVRRNRVRGGRLFGIELNGATGSRVSDNDLANGAGSGLVAQGVSTGNQVRRNEIHGYAGNGIRLLAAATGNLLVSNDARGNEDDDCQDDPEGSAWTENLGDESIPVGICTPAP